MTAAGKAILAAFMLLLLLLGVGSWQLTAARRRVTELELAPAKAATATAAARVETVTVRLAAIHDTVTRVLRSLRTDTLVLRPQTRQDTATALAQLPVLAAHFDTLQRSCSAFVVSCDQFRAAASARFAADSVYRVGLEAALRGASPSRFGAAWNTVKMPLAFGAGLYFGERLTR